MHNEMKHVLLASALLCSSTLPAGVLGIRDIVRWIVEQLPEELANIPPRPGGPRSVDGG